MAEDIRPSATYESAVITAMEELRLQLPPECRGILRNDDAAMRLIARDLAVRGCDDVLARLVGDADVG